MPLGFHVSRKNSGRARPMSVALREDMDVLKSYGFTPCAQIFVSGPRGFVETLTEAEKIAVRKYIVESDAVVVIHGAYVDNPWSRSAGSIHNIKQEMRIAARLGATGVIVHLAAGAADDDNLQHVLKAVADLPEDVLAGTVLWLETHTAKSSPYTYETTKKVRRLFDRVAAVDKGALRVGLCIDTAHLFACGMNLATADAAEKWLADLPDVPIMLHLNDSGSTLGSGKDVHAALTRGNIWDMYNPEEGHLDISDSGLVTILSWAEKNNIVTILERDEDSISADLSLIRQFGYFQQN